MRAFLLVLIAVPALAVETFPRRLAHEGRLLRADGSPERGMVELTFRIYDVPTGGAHLWTETQTVTLSNFGYYGVQLGSTAALPTMAGAAYWLGITVGGESEMTPRANLASAPFALRAARADDADKLGGDLPAAFVRTPVKIGASGAIVSGISVNARSTCGSIAPIPRMEIYINGELLAGADVPNATYADSATFPVDPPRYASEITVAFPNDSGAGGCDHNLFVDHINLTTPYGVVAVRSSDTAHVVYDISSYFDGINVVPGGSDMAFTGALRFFLAPAPLGRPAGYGYASTSTSWSPPTTMSAANGSPNEVPGLSVTLTTYGGDLLIDAVFFISFTAGRRGEFSASIDGAWVGTYLGWGSTWVTWYDGIMGQYGGSEWDTRVYHRVVPGVPPGTHTIKMLGWNETASGWYINCCSMVSQMTVREMPRR